MAAPQDEAPAGSRPVAAPGRSPLREGVTRGSARSRPSVCIALAILLSVALSAADHAPAQAQPPAAWLLDHFEVVHTEDVHDEVETRRYTTPGSNIDAFPFGGTKVYTGTYPTGKLIATGTLAVELPDKITPGTPFQIGGGATGQVGTPGRTGQTAATLVAYNECYVRAVCSGALKSQYLDNVEGKTVDLAAPLAAQSATLPADPQAWPPLHVVMFRGTIGTTTPGDPVWRVYVYAYYKRPETVPTPVPSFRLEVDADASRLPPSGTSPSEAVVTATMVDGAGKAIAGEVLTFALDPPDMGTIAPATGVTDAAGEVRVRYRAPKADVLGGRDSVAVVVRNAARSLERRFALRIERYRLTLKVDPADIPIEPVWRAVRVTAELRDFDGRAVVGDVLQFRVDPPDMGSFIGGTMSAGKAPTDGSGRVEAFYEPPPPSQLRGRDRATIYVSNVTHGGEEGAGVRFIGLKIIRTWPAADARDIVLESDDTVDIEFDRPIDPATVTGATVKLETLWHGDLGTRPESFGPSANLRVTADPVPDVGLRVKVTVAGGENGVKGRDGAVMAGPHTFWFRTMPKFDPKIIVSQVVDNPRDRLFGYITLSVKPFALRVDAGISEDSELEDERVAVRLLIPRRSADMTLEHTFYPGRWPPKVPDAAAKKGNTANFIVPAPIGRGGYTVQAELRPVHAVPEKVITVPPVSFNVNSWSDVGAARKIGLLAVPIVNDQIPGSAWTVSRGQQEQWLLGLAQPAANLLPLTRLDLRLSYSADTTCNDPDAPRGASVDIVPQVGQEPRPCRFHDPDLRLALFRGAGPARLLRPLRRPPGRPRQPGRVPRRDPKRYLVAEDARRWRSHRGIGLPDLADGGRRLAGGPRPRPGRRRGSRGFGRRPRPAEWLRSAERPRDPLGRRALDRREPVGDEPGRRVRQHVAGDGRLRGVHGPMDGAVVFGAAAVPAAVCGGGERRRRPRRTSRGGNGRGRGGRTGTGPGDVDLGHDPSLRERRGISHVRSHYHGARHTQPRPWRHG